MHKYFSISLEIIKNYFLFIKFHGLRFSMRRDNYIKKLLRNLKLNCLYENLKFRNYTINLLIRVVKIIEIFLIFQKNYLIFPTGRIRP